MTKTLKTCNDQTFIWDFSRSAVNILKIIQNNFQYAGGCTIKHFTDVIYGFS